MKKSNSVIVVLVLVWIALTCVFLSVAPERVPVHFGVNGEVDRWGSKFEYLLFPGMGILVGVCQIFGIKLSKKRSEHGNEKVTAVSGICLTGFLMLMSLFFMYKALDPDTLQFGLGELSMKGTGLLLMVLFIVMGNIMPKVRRNSSLGLRTRWSMYSDTCWQKSQRLGGYTMAVTGVVGLLLIALLPGNWTAWILLGILLPAIIICVVGSYRIYQREREKE